MPVVLAVTLAENVRSCRVLGSRHVMAHAFRIELDAGTLAIRSLGQTAERGDLAGPAVPRCKPCLDAVNVV